MHPLLKYAEYLGRLAARNEFTKVAQPPQMQIFPRAPWTQQPWHATPPPLGFNGPMGGMGQGPIGGNFGPAAQHMPQMPNLGGGMNFPGFHQGLIPQPQMQPGQFGPGMQQPQLPKPVQPPKPVAPRPQLPTNPVAPAPIPKIPTTMPQETPMERPPLQPESPQSNNGQLPLPEEHQALPEENTGFTGSKPQPNTPLAGPGNNLGGIGKPDNPNKYLGAGPHGIYGPNKKQTWFPDFERDKLIDTTEEGQNPSGMRFGAGKGFNKGMGVSGVVGALRNYPPAIAK